MLHVLKIVVLRFYGCSCWHLWETQSHSKFPIPMALENFISPLKQWFLKLWCWVLLYPYWTGLHNPEFLLVLAFYNSFPHSPAAKLKHDIHLYDLLSVKRESPSQLCSGMCKHMSHTQIHTNTWQTNKDILKAWYFEITCLFM